MAASALALDEIFLSLQGEAGEVGRPHLFLRLGGCPLRCDYCDTPRSWTVRPRWQRHEASGSTEQPNPVPLDALAGELHLVASSHGVAATELVLAVTGGEPLEQAEALEQWLPGWPAPILLETAGIYPERLARLLPWLRYLSLDWKLRSSLRSGGERNQAAACATLWHKSGVAGWVKIVVAAGTPEAELAEALEHLGHVAPGARAYLQPATPVPGGPAPAGPAQLLAWVLRFRGLHLDLRVQPQIHPLLGLR